MKAQLVFNDVVYDGWYIDSETAKITDAERKCKAYLDFART